MNGCKNRHESSRPYLRKQTEPRCNLLVQAILTFLTGYINSPNSMTLPGVKAMKKIEAIIRHFKLEDVKNSLSEMGIHGMTITEVRGFGRQKGHTEMYRGHEVAVNLLRKVQLQIAVNEEFVQPTVDAVIKGARTGDKGEIGDGKIFILPMDDCVRIRTGERGPDAI